MSARDHFKQFVSNQLGPLAREHGFNGRGKRLQLGLDEVLQVISVQKSQSSSRAEVIFTVELAVIVRSLAAAETATRRASDRALAGAAPHWVRRLGHLAPSGRDTWWTVNEDRRQFEEALSWLDAYGFPALRRLSTAGALMKLWESGTSPGLTEPQRLVFLSRLAEAEGAAKTQVAADAELRRYYEQKPVGIIGQRLAELTGNNPLQENPREP